MSEEEDVWKGHVDKLSDKLFVPPEEAIDMLQNFMRSHPHAPVTQVEIWAPDMPMQERQPTCYRCGLSVTSRIHERR